MKPLLMHVDHDFDMAQELPSHAGTLAQDLELNTLFQAMANGDHFLFQIAEKALFTGFGNDLATILYRQQVLKDCLENPDLARELYSIAVETVEGKKKRYISVLRNYPSGTLYDAIHALEFLVEMLRKLTDFGSANASRFQSRGFVAFFAMLCEEFTEAYFAGIERHLSVLRFRWGVPISAALGNGNEGIDYVLHEPLGKQPNWLQRIFGKRSPGYTFRLADRDEAGARILSEMRDRGINLVANALAQSTDHVLSFFAILRAELGFYIACLNLHERLASRGAAISFPQPLPPNQRKHNFGELRDPCLMLAIDRPVVANTLNADGKNLVVITGANQGGKSSFLRSVGLAQLMMQCGSFVAAKSFAANMVSSLHTHYKREEDSTMRRGKLDEELSRASEIVEGIAPNAMVLFNESFSSTNEREGSEIAMQIVGALADSGMKIFIVTHLYEFAHKMFENGRHDSAFLRAERQSNGARTFRLVEDQPLNTSYGSDMYTQVFGASR